MSRFISVFFSTDKDGYKFSRYTELGNDGNMLTPLYLRTSDNLNDLIRSGWLHSGQPSTLIVDSNHHSFTGVVDLGGFHYKLSKFIKAERNKIKLNKYISKL